MSDTKTPLDGITLEAVVADEQDSMRLDRFLAAALPELSRSRLEGLIESGAASLNGKTIRDTNHRVKPRDLYRVTLPEVRPAAPEGQDIPLSIVYEDKELVVIDKPAGLVVHPAAGNPDGTLVNALIAHCGGELAGIGGEMRPGIVHRIDKDTSGLLVAAKTERAMKGLSKQFADHSIERAYNAVIWGAPRAGNGVIEGDIGRNPFDRKRMAVVRGGGKEARTRYRVLESYGDPARPFASLIECRLETGRTHQIRVHLTHLGHPLVGDPSYGRSRQAPRPKTEVEAAAYAAATDFPRQALHAWLLGFIHPVSKEAVRFESPWPDDFSRLIAALRPLKKP